ncbi:plasmid mobilization relaxosome protein MobC [Pseudomonas eucalypticola]|uniref:Plasmid mobilization relaxosome protein MobC n=1 Tax=Pseudomonas eucalypticola TaxID=2599595 RepID=A0A7D5HB64_9PSED|nr:plasmid mobilization relaxosome protein MobC [Pseudomonas eucalypticola]QKZ07844.1 plasmid mobilization relaxosome protein MobC [Pseudomonas eucalypticola]
MPSKKPMLSARVEADTKSLFDQRAASLNMTTAALLEKLVEAYLQKAPPEPPPLVTLSDPAKGKAKAWVDVPLAPSEGKALDELAGAMGWPRSKYLAQLFRVHLSAEPRFSEKEMLELRQVTMQLAALGRNVNQVARALNVSLDNANQAHAVQWEVMHRVIDVHRKYVKALVKGNLDYWGMNDGDE